MAKSAFRTKVCDDLNIKYPIFLAGMGAQGKATPPKLVAAVSDAGGLGVLGCSWLDANEVRRRIREVRSLTDKPFGVGLLLPVSMDQSSIANRDEMRARIRRDHPKHIEFVEQLLKTYELKPVPAPGDAMSPEFIRAQVEVCLEEKIAVFAAGLGDPSWMVKDAHSVGTKVLGLVGSVRAAQRQLAAGVDYIVAQGTEAGGHTGRVANFPLIPAIVDAVAPKPVIAAGGIADGRGLVAALALGAVGVWVGTAFLIAEESKIFPTHQDEILRGRPEDFVITRTYTGKTARDYNNPVIEAWENTGLKPLPMPLQGVLMRDFAAAAEAAGRYDLVNNPAGQIAGILNKKRPAKEILESMVREAEIIADNIAALRA